MRKELTVKIERPQLWLDTEITFAQVPGWCDHLTMDLKMSIIRHHERDQRPLPCIVWLCGGGWMQMDRHAHLADFAELARAGFVIASAEYRTSNFVPFPAQIEDVKAAIRYLRANAARYAIDPERIGIMGESAGGYLAAMAGVTGKTREFDKGLYLEESSAVQAVCDWYGPTDLGKMIEAAKGAAGLQPEAIVLGGRTDDAAFLSRMNPIDYVGEDTPPFLILHGKEDQVVPFVHSEWLYDALTRAGRPAEFYALEGANHADLHFFQPQVQEIIREFFTRRLGAQHINA